MLRADPEWTLGSSYLRRKLQNTDTADDNVAYRLHSRLVSRSEREAETDKEQVEVSSQGSEQMLANTRNETSPGKNRRAAVNHSYNLRSRIESPNKNAQE
jgi:hypothetical protein